MRRDLADDIRYDKIINLTCAKKAVCIEFYMYVSGTVYCSADVATLNQ